MARSTLEEREDHVLESHLTTLPECGQVPGQPTTAAVPRIGRFHWLSPYLSSRGVRQYGGVVRSGSPGDGGNLRRGAELRLSAGVGLDVPPGQSVALLSQPHEVAVELLDVVAGLQRPLPGRPGPADSGRGGPAVSGRAGLGRAGGGRAGGGRAGAAPGAVLVDGVAVDQLRGASLDRFRASRGLLSPRFPLLPSRSVLDNVLAALPDGRADAPVRARATELLRLTGVESLAAPVQALTAEQQWRVLVARALVPAPRLVLAEDPATGLEPRAATALWDVVTDMHAAFGFTLLVAASGTASAIRCQRIVTLSGWTVTDDELTGGDDPWTRGRIDRIG
jgi:putative ABC transport system ATP-binding protein